MKQQKQNNAGMKRGGFARGVNRLLSGSYLTREYVQANLPFIFFVVLIMLAYIAYGYYAEKNVKALVQSEAMLRELKAQHTAAEAQLEQIKQQSDIARRVHELGLQENTVPPVVIRTSEKPDQDS